MADSEDKEQILVRYGQLLLKEDKHSYWIHHIACNKSLYIYNKPKTGTSRYLDIGKCKCGVSKQGMDYLMKTLKLLI